MGGKITATEDSLRFDLKYKVHYIDRLDIYITISNTDYSIKTFEMSKNTYLQKESFYIKHISDCRSNNGLRRQPLLFGKLRNSLY